MKPPVISKNNALSTEKNKDGEISTAERSLDSGKCDKDGSAAVDPHEEFGIGKGYINMNVVEKEKLQWMKRLPKVHTKKVLPTAVLFGN